MPIGRWLTVYLGGWATSTARAAAAKSYVGLLTARIFSGILGAGIPPALMLISGLWCTRPEHVLRFVWCKWLTIPSSIAMQVYRQEMRKVYGYGRGIHSRRLPLLVRPAYFSNYPGKRLDDIVGVRPERRAAEPGRTCGGTWKTNDSYQLRVRRTGTLCSRSCGSHLVSRSRHANGGKSLER